jgi:predicted anti-sigma-YlaC factor YlaD
MDTELSCKAFVEVVTAYLDAALDPVLERRVVEHLRDCEGCEAYLEQIRHTIGLLRTLADSPAMPVNKQELLELFRLQGKES